MNILLITAYRLLLRIVRYDYKKTFRVQYKFMFKL